jgi:tRNA-splicing ligase RtcB
MIDQALRRMGEPDIAGDVLAYDSEAAGFFREALDQLGTLGGGNHFIELQADEAGRVYLMLHSGSRSYGAKVCKSSHRQALDLNKAWHSRLPDDELAFLPVESAKFQQYWNRMQFGLAYAEVSRMLMVGAVLQVLDDMTPMNLYRQTLDVHHNYAAWENHFGKNGIVHRKGAVRARKDELVAIPGSMGTGSYIARGLGNPESFNTCQHGAGRSKTRTAMRKSMTTAEVFGEMASLGVVLVSSDPKKVMEEAPGAYKDIQSVMDQSADLIEPVLKLRPLGVVKG